MSATPSPARWDCHAHLFGPYTQFPLAPERSYTPPEAPAKEYLSMLSDLGLHRGVLVHPSAYGEDHSLLLNTLDEHDQLRGVVVLRPGSSLPLAGLRERGVRGARFSHRSGAAGNFAGSASFDDLLAMAAALADSGLHAELWTDCKALPQIASRIRTLPVPVVIDHMGGFDPQAGLDDPGFGCLLELLGTGQIWVKLCAYRNLLNCADPQIGQSFQQAMMQANPDRLVWGSDWPHLRVTPAPDTHRLLDTFMEWTNSANAAHQILSTNPEALYG